MDFDIIIAGAGPAGLSIAAELSKHFKVMIFDRRKIPFTTAAWFTYSERVKKHGLEKAVINKCDSLVYIAKNVSNTMMDDIAILNSNKVLKIWHDKAKKNHITTKQLSLNYYKKMR